MTTPDLAAAIDAARKAIRRFPFDDYGLVVDPESKHAEWVEPLARKILKAAEKPLRRAWAEQTAQAIEAKCDCGDLTDPAIVAVCEYIQAAAIVREMGATDA